MGTDFGLYFQGISNSSSSECNIYLGNYEKSYNNVLFTAFIIRLLGSECSQPPNHKQRCSLPSGSKASASCSPLGLRSFHVPGVLHQQAQCQTLGPRKPTISRSTQSDCPKEGTARLLEKDTRDSGGDNCYVCPSKQAREKIKILGQQNYALKNNNLIILFCVGFFCFFFFLVTEKGR